MRRLYDVRSLERGSQGGTGRDRERSECKHSPQEAERTEAGPASSHTGGVGTQEEHQEGSDSHTAQEDLYDTT